MKPPRPRRDPRSPLLSTLPRTQSVEDEIRELSGRVRVLLELLNVCQLADGKIDPRHTTSTSAPD
jgi:hypothetical protein